MNPNPWKQYPSYQPMLKESINRFLTEYRKGAETDFTIFTSIFSRTLHTTPNPPIPLMWFYSALEFHINRLRSETSNAAMVVTSKGLFQLLVSCSAGCGSMKRIGVLVPLIFVVYRLVVNEKEVKCDVEGLVEGIVSYCSILCGNEIQCDDHEVAISEDEFVDLMKVWMVDCDFDGIGDCVKGFFPFVSEQFLKGIEMSFEVGFLAGVVMFQALLLKLCLDFDVGITRIEQEKKLHASAAQIIRGFRNFYFLDTLLRMMLEPVLPVISLLGSENEVLFKEVLFNSVMMMDYSFIIPQARVSLSANSLKDFAINCLFVAELAIQSARENGDQWKAISYVNTFRRSCIPIQLINWVTSQSINGRKISTPTVSTPIALIKWLEVVEEQGLAVFGNHHAKAFSFTSSTNFMLPGIEHFCNDVDKNLLTALHGGTKSDRIDGDMDMLDTVDTVSLSADDKMIPATNDGTRKRKEGSEDDPKAQLKYMRCQYLENSVRETSFIFRQQ